MRTGSRETWFDVFASIVAGILVITTVILVGLELLW